ncbi:MAG TPA: polysaccharide biosynthesis/export family protein [Fibrobacteria bacterium]|nr:polysaccharide biosynthesis/export family protein [Fibrobacteria bacterium]
MNESSAEARAYIPIPPHSRRALPWLIAVAMCLGGCASFDAKYRHESLRAPATEVKLEYRAQPGDKINVNFMRDLRDSLLQTYRLQQGDEVQVTVQDREDLSRISKIAPDGKIYFAYLEPIPAEGLTLEELRKVAEGKYQPVAQSARVTLVPIRFAGKIEAMQDGLSSSLRPGSIYETVVGVDGKAVFPQLGFLQVVGKTPQELNVLLQAKYREILPGSEITTNLIGGTSRLLTVLGEMRHPGSFDVNGTVSLTTALGLAEGWLPSAHLEDIILVQKRGGQVTISKYDLHKDLMVATQLQLTGGDFVFVPRSAITDLNVFIDQYIRRNLPFAVGLSIPIPLLNNP